MKFTLLALFISLLISISAQNREIVFETKLTFNELVQKAKNENKLIFIDAYTTWCGPCKWMAKTMFTKNEIADYYNQNFINAKFDMEKGEGIELAKKFEVFCYPNLLFIDENGELVHRSAGAAQEISDYIDLGETAKNSEKRFSTLLKEYELKKTDLEFSSHFIDVISQTCLPYDNYLNDYFAMQKDEDLSSEINWYMINRHLNSYRTREFSYLLNHIVEFEYKYTKEEVHAKIFSVLESSAQNIIYDKNYQEKNLKAFVSEINEMNFQLKDKVLFSIKMMELEKLGDMNVLFDYVVKEGDKYLEGDQINSISWSIYENSEKKSHLSKASEWMRKLTETETGRTWQNLDTYAAVLYKLKDKKMAKQVAIDAIELAKITGISQEDYKETQDLLKKIEKL